MTQAVLEQLWSFFSVHHISTHLHRIYMLLCHVVVAASIHCAWTFDFMTKYGVLSVQLTGHHRLNQNNEMLRHLIDMRNPYIDPVNVLQVEILKRLRNDPDDQGLRDALLVTINGIASGMRNTG